MDQCGPAAHCRTPGGAAGGAAGEDSEAADGDLPARVAAAEEFYRRHGQPARFQISPAAWPAGLDDTLASRGYHRQTPVLLLSADARTIAGRLGPPSPAGAMTRVEVIGSPTEAWLRAWSGVQAGEAVDLAVERQLLRRVAQPSGYAAAVVDGEVVAVSRAVADGGWAGVFGMAARPHARGQGAGRADRGGTTGSPHRRMRRIGADAAGAFGQPDHRADGRARGRAASAARDRSQAAATGTYPNRQLPDARIAPRR